MLTALKLLTAIGLGAGYLSVAFLAEHPRVDAEYDAHFLHRVANCWIPAALRAQDPNPIPPASVEIAHLSQPEACRYLRIGWWNLEPWGVWANGDKATLNLPRRPGAQAVELTLRGVPLPGPTIRAWFVLNGQVAERDVAPGTIATLVFPLPPADESYNPAMHLSFDRYALVVNPVLRLGKPEMRHVGVGLIAIRYLPAPPMANASVHGRAL